VIVAVVRVRVVQDAVDEVVGVIAVRHGLVTASRAVLMLRVVAAGRARAVAGIAGADRDDVLVDMVLVGVVQVAVVQVVDVALVRDRGVPAVGAVDVGVISMDRVVG
jgi:hypothetical protein